MLKLLFVLSASLGSIGQTNDAMTVEVHRLIAAERFEQADRVAQTALAHANGDDAISLQHRLATLNLLIDSAIAQHRLTSDACGRWIDEVFALHTQLALDPARAHAKALAVASMRARRSAATSGAIQHANQLARQSADLVEHATGELAPFDEAFVYQAIAAMEIDGGRMSQGVAALEHAKAILTPARTEYEKSILAQVLATLGPLELQTGDRAQGLSDAHAGVDLARKIAGSDSRQYAAALAELGKVQFFSADIVAAKQSLQQALAILRHHPDEIFTTNITTNFLANTTVELGDLDAARPLYREAVATSKDDAGIYLAGRLNGLAVLEKMAGNLATSRDLLVQALALEEQRHDRSYYGLVPMLNNLGVLSLKQDDLVAAQTSFQRALDIASARSGGVIFDVLSAREGLASVALARGTLQEADTLLTKSIDELERGYGNGHPDLTFLRCERALAKARLGEHGEAFALALSSENLRVDLLRRTAPALGESEMVNLKARLNDCGGLVAALAASAHDDEQIKQAWQLLAASRGLAAHLSSARLIVARNATDASKRQAWSTWDSAARSYAELLLKTRVAGDALGKARSALQEAESRLDVPKDAAAEITDIMLPDLLRDQPDATSLVAYFVVDQFDLEASARSDPQVHRLVKSPHSLYAFVRQHDAIRLVALGDSATIDFKIEYWNRLLRDPHSDSAQLATAGRAVREAVWDPLAIAGEPGRVFVVPDGALYRVNFDALADGEGYLVERGWRVHLLDSERDLAVVPATPPQHSLLLVGAPDFGHLTTSAGVRGEACAGGFAALPATKREIAGVATLWDAASTNPPTILTGGAASKEALRHAAARSEIIHIATHAAEFDRKCNTGSSRGMGISTLAATPTALKPAALALAGANAFLDHGDASGILTSEEVVTMPLDNAQWVVLSACDTGLGPVVYGEGVFGLRRAFRLAGARTVIMSLWEVDDNATAEWMQALYRSRLAGHASVPESIAQAQLAVLAARRARGESVHPYFWAAFVASGDWH